MMRRLIWVVFLIGCLTSEAIDDDGDGVENYEDNCLMVENADQKDLNKNGIGDACDGDWEKYLFDRCGDVEVCCGDGILNEGEECDDGNDIDGDQCTNNCQEAVCGDGIVFKGKEACDDGNDVNIDECRNDCSIGVEMISIKGGSFMMGSEEGESDEKPVHRVEVRDFYMSKTEVTVGQYRKCVEAGGCSKPNSCNWTDSVGDKENHPINCVDWEQARTFAKWVGGDLPSEAQWEYAARSGGREIKYPWGNEEATCEIASFDGCGRTTPVCSKTGGNTVQGLCDMGGNVWEWVLDEWHGSYSGAPSDDRGWCSDRGCESDTSADRVFRGGSWGNNASALRSALRNNRSPGYRLDRLGFRVSDTVP